jgi:serine/threonine protein kinase, bacterial
MSYCVNPACPNPENAVEAKSCAACGSELLLSNRYRIMQALGQGGFGATFLAKDENLPGTPLCVIKQLRPSATSFQVLQMSRDLFKREAKTLGKIGNHPQIPRLLDYFETDREFYLIQEFVSGATLQQEVKRFGTFSESAVKQFLSEILPLMQFIHSQQVIHRDIKPANIIRRAQDKKLVLIDFGAVKDQVNPNVGSLSEQTALTAYAIGTPGYAPPEQMAMRPVYASDIYALGITCLYLLTGKSPKDMNYDPMTGELMWKDYIHVSSHLVEVLTKMLDVSVRHRFQNSDEVLRSLDLEPYLDSLANGMMSTTHRARQDQPTEATSPSSPSSKMAAAIRARNLKQGNEATKVQRGAAAVLPRAGNTTGGRAGNVKTAGRAMGRSPSGLPPKPEAKALVAAYMRGLRDFNSLDFTALQLVRADLSGANFHQARFPKANLQGANLSNADFGGASLSQVNLKNANLGKAYLSHADLGGADLRGADLRNSYLSNANLRGANLCGADLTGAKVTEEQLALARTNWSTVSPSGKRGLW